MEMMIPTGLIRPLHDAFSYLRNRCGGWDAQDALLAQIQQIQKDLEVLPAEVALPIGDGKLDVFIDILEQIQDGNDDEFHDLLAQARDLQNGLSPDNPTM